MKRGKMSEEEKATIIKMRNENKGYTEIADVLGCAKDRVKYYCQVNGLGGFKARLDSDPGGALNRFVENFNNKFSGKFEYAGGYVNGDQRIDVKCLRCGNQFDRAASAVRKANKTITCRRCAAEDKRAAKEREAAKRRRLKKEAKRLAEIERNKPRNLICKNYGEPFESKRKKMYCSNKCMHKYNHARKTLRRRKWAERNGQVEWDITVDKLVKLYNNTCYLCNEECDSQDYKRRDDRTFIAGGNYPSIEHVIPLSKGGTHTWDNVRLAHIHCNVIKSDKQKETNREQLELPV